MLLAPRKLAFVVLAGLALVAAGCGSNNKGKIVGKWKADSVGDGDPKMAQLGDDMGLFFEFSADGKFNASVSILGTTKEVGSAKYSLGSGDWVNLTDINPPQQDGKTQSKEKVTINGDKMTILGENNKTMTFTRVK